MSDGPIHDPDLLDALEAMERVALRREAWRVTWATRDPLAGGTGGGRWHPPNDFEALYTSLEEHGAMAEIYHHLSKAPVFSSSHTRISRLAVRTERSLVIDSFDALRDLGVDEDGFRRSDYARTREIGAAARFLDVDALVVPSAQWPCANLVIFPDRLADPAALKVVESRDVNWPAWRERASRPALARRTADDC